jgi:hypothetical protein
MIFDKYLRWHKKISSLALKQGAKLILKDWVEKNIRKKFEN